MRLLHAVLIFLGLSLDSFVVMMNKGATMLNLSFPIASLYALIYSIANVVAVLLGYGISVFLQDLLLDRLEIGFACLIIFGVGLYLCFKAYRMKDIEERVDKSFGLKQCFLLALFTSIDTFCLGVGFSFFDISLKTALLLALLITFVTTCSALTIGYSQGSRYNRLVSMSGGTLMIIFSLYLLTHYVMMLR